MNIMNEQINLNRHGWRCGVKKWILASTVIKHNIHESNPIWGFELEKNG